MVNYVKEHIFSDLLLLSYYYPPMSLSVFLMTIFFHLVTVGGNIAFDTCSFYFEKATPKTWHHTVPCYSLITTGFLMMVL